MRRVMSRGRAIALLLMSLRRAEGQIFDLEMRAPDPRSLHTLAAFYVYAEGDDPQGTGTAATVEFHDLRVSAPEKLPHMDGYVGIQVWLVPYSDFWRIVDPEHFCCSRADVSQGVCAVEDQALFKEPPPPRRRGGAGVTHREVDAFMSAFATKLLEGRRLADLEGRRHLDGIGAEPRLRRGPSGVVARTVRVNSSDGPVREVFPLARTDVYVLVLSNCGGLLGSMATVSGSVVVRNPYGYLPGTDYYKLPFYFVLMVAYACAVCAWGALLLKWREQLFKIQKSILAVLCLACAQAMFCFADLTTWNMTGRRSSILTYTAMLSLTAKEAGTYAALLTASLGWGVTRPELEKSLARKLFAVFLAYMFLFIFSQLHALHGRSAMPSAWYVLTILVPFLLLQCFLICWAFRGLWGVIRNRRQQQRFDHLLFFQRLRCVLAIALATSAAAMLFKCVNMWRSITFRWKSQWLLSGGFADTLMFAVHCAVMYLWAPNKYIQSGNIQQSAETLLPELGGGEAPPAERRGEDVGKEDEVAQASSRAEQGLRPSRAEEETTPPPDEGSRASSQAEGSLCASPVEEEMAALPDEDSRASSQAEGGVRPIPVEEEMATLSDGGARASSQAEGGLRASPIEGEMAALPARCSAP